MHWFRSLAALAIALPVIAACDDDNNEPSEATSFTATLAGTSEVPPVTTTATGTATFTITGGAIQYTVNVTGIENVVVAHIHTGLVGQNGPVRLNLCGTGDPQPPCTGGTGVLATGTNGTTVGDPPITFDQLVEAMRSDSAYANVHTLQNHGWRDPRPARPSVGWGWRAGEPGGPSCHCPPALSGRETHPSGSSRTTRGPPVPGSAGRSRSPWRHGRASPPPAPAAPPRPARAAPRVATGAGPGSRTPHPERRSTARSREPPAPPTAPGSQRVQVAPGIVSQIAQLLRDAEELVVLGGSIGAARAPGLDLARASSHREIGDEGVLGLAGAV